jgi:hypothetical protein
MMGTMGTMGEQSLWGAVAEAAGCRGQRGSRRGRARQRVPSAHLQRVGGGVPRVVVISVAGRRARRADPRE